MNPSLTVQCPACHQPMVERENSHTGQRFLGCTAYPTCLQTAPIPAFIEAQRAGGMVLPGFDQEDDDA